MTLTKAIEILLIHNDHNPNFTDAEREESHQLGIEALKAWQSSRKFSSINQVPLLPGETEA